MTLGFVRYFVVVLAAAAVGLSPVPSAAQQAAAARGMSVAEIPEDPPPAPAPTPEASAAPAADPQPLRDLAERFARPEPVADARENLPLGTSSRGGEVIDQPTYSTGGAGWVLNTLASLGLVIGLILLLRWGWSRMGGYAVARSTPAVEVLSRTQVAPRNHVLLVRVGGRILVLGDSVAGLRTLANVEEPDEVANLLEAVTAARNNSVTRGFMQLLNQTEQGYDSVRLREEGGDDGEYRIDRARDSVSGLLARVKALSGKGGA